ncbi:hypothetical protein DES53_104287 [Roseimicrobium gellanilyticum]|uniref:Uncharacterized protein n=1 Tax=Roseimicrobium gellanilyticum TaxID=748857 RepID=A0A366HNV6_9BACT|nr:hypothetical protein [Roseimicrobium gellanilyticum]RBP44466.1 hypothetical protein DES53_104287 [Roseimicrobium gellanilyticum]
MIILKRVLLALVLVFVGVLLALGLLFRASKDIVVDTRMELVACAVAAQDYRNTHGKWPENRGQIDASVSTALGMGGGGRQDEWGRPFLLAVDQSLDQAVLQTYGPDGKSDTRDGGLRVVVMPQQLTVYSE